MLWNSLSKRYNLGPEIQLNKRLDKKKTLPHSKLINLIGAKSFENLNFVKNEVETILIKKNKKLSRNNIEFDIEEISL